MTEESHRFEADWLSLREPADHRSRAAELIPPLVSAWRGRGWRRVVDLGCGTGSNLRFLSPRLPGPQEWVVVDHDPEHLARLIEGVPEDESDDPASSRSIHPVCGSVEAEGLAQVRRADLVTCSALLDLVTEGWLRDLVDALAHEGKRGAYFALSYDGTFDWDVPDPDDASIRGAVNAHQHRDKGMGPALGPDAVMVVEDLLRGAGFHMETGASPWRLRGTADAPLAAALVHGWAEAALEQLPADASSIRAWRARRLATIRDGDFALRVGHRDVLALPA